MARKLIYATLIAALCWTTVPAQPEDPDTAPEVYYETHSLAGIPVAHGDWFPEFDEAPVPRILSMERGGFVSGPVFAFGGAQWHSSWGSAPDGPFDAEQLAESLDRLAQPYPRGQMRLRGDEITWAATRQEHETFRWLLDQLRAYHAQRVRFAVFELGERAPSGPVSAERALELRRGATLMATRVARPREVALVSTLRSVTYTADYETSVATGASAHRPVTLTMHSGREIALSACAAPDGTLIVRAMRAQSVLNAMRTHDGPPENGKLELPDYSWAIEEGGVRLRDGQSWVFGDRFLVAASIQNPYTGTWHPSEPLAALPPDLLVRRTADRPSLAPGARVVRLAFQSRFDDPWSSPTSPLHDFSFEDEESIVPELRQRLTAGDTRLQTVGPLVFLKWSREGAPPRAEVEPPVPADIALQVRRWHVPRGAAASEDLANGTLENATLRRLGEPAYSRRLYQLEGGSIEDSDFTLRNFLGSYDTNVAAESSAYDPRVGALVSGTRLSIELGADGRAGVPVEVMFGFAPRGEIKVSAVKPPGHGAIETAEIASTAMQLRGELRIGESISAVTPMPENPNLLIVLALTRIEP
jgi:hypothetical protein